MAEQELGELEESEPHKQCDNGDGEAEILVVTLRDGTTYWYCVPCYFKASLEAIQEVGAAAGAGA